jgi:hypothetical protein
MYFDCYSRDLHETRHSLSCGLLVLSLLTSVFGFRLGLIEGDPTCIIAGDAEYHI